MEEQIFLKKYLGEVTLKNGEHVKFLFPCSETVFRTTQNESTCLYKNLTNNPENTKNYSWALFDNLNLTQFQVVYANIKIYGDNYWKKLWEERKKNN